MEDNQIPLESEINNDRNMYYFTCNNHSLDELNYLSIADIECAKSYSLPQNSDSVNQ